MAEIKFGYKDAIAHGWAMTKKYWKIILMVAVIYFLFSLVNGVLENGAGKRGMARSEVNWLITDPTLGNQFYQYLQDAGYLDKYGATQEPLERLSSADDLNLPAEFEKKRIDIYKFLDRYRYHLPFPKPVYYLLTVLLWLVNTLMGIGAMKMSLMVTRDQEPTLSELYTNWPIFIPYVLGGICYFLVVLVGFILLIIPGFIFMLMFQMYAYLIVDKGLDPIVALKRSRVITKGQKGRLAVFGLLLLLLNLGGLLCLLVGVFVTAAISYVAMAYVYDRLENAPVVNA